MDQLRTRLETIIRKVESYHPSPDVERIRKAFEYAYAHHEVQVRKSGEPYLTHLLEVTDIIAELRLDSASLCAGLLHDTVEDTEYSLDALREGLRSFSVASRAPVPAVRTAAPRRRERAVYCAAAVPAE